MSFHEHVTASVIANSKMLKAQLSPDSEVTNNHAIGEYAAIMLSGIYLNDSKMIQFSSKNLKKELDRQIYDDGISYEGTIPYLRFNLDFLTLFGSAFFCLDIYSTTHHLPSPTLGLFWLASYQHCLPLRLVCTLPGW